MRTAPRTARFDDLVEALQSEVARAQRSIDERHQGRLQQLLDLDREGSPEAVAYVLQVKTPGPAGEQTLRVPLLTLRRNTCHQVVAASLELHASFEEAPGEEPALAAAVGGNPLRRAFHRLRVALIGPQPGTGEIALDDRTLRALPPPSQEN
jgi:hypothetical protein